jgi:transglutaminase-like putative cysteine protease
MSFLTVHHTTVYRYLEPVRLGEHRMMFRPRASHDLRLIETNLLITPQPVELRWLHDPFDNSVAIATFEGTTTELSFESKVSIEHFENTQLEYPLEEYARFYPFRYADEDFPNLMRALDPHYPAAAVSKWALQFLDASDKTPTMRVLTAMTCGIREGFTYTRRVEKGVQTPDETLRSRKGSCRDFAVLMMEAVRYWGFGARFVTGYIQMGEGQHGATHAWTEVYIPGIGWQGFDPTNDKRAGTEHVAVAVAREQEKASPLSGTWDGPNGSFERMDVSVQVFEV